jgi:hypothetical protein
MSTPTEHEPGTPEPGNYIETGFAGELRALLNRHSVENRSDTPDFILASFLQNVLIDWEHAVRARDKWYGEDRRG